MGEEQQEWTTFARPRRRFVVRPYGGRYSVLDLDREVTLAVTDTEKDARDLANKWEISGGPGEK